MSKTKQNPIDLGLRDSICWLKKCVYESTGTKLDGKFHYFAVEGTTVDSLRYDKINDKVILNEGQQDQMSLPATLPPSIKNEYFFSNEDAQEYGKLKNQEVFEEVTEFVKEAISLQNYLKELVEEGC